ncbi:hypothetical protein [Bdellovibrio sp. HCB288]|uniref:hypothetical protein n=1 Tax=Bdellovibrio sp. HCB288 TaxID=3394355 RepID=UPI0039B6C076
MKNILPLIAAILFTACTHTINFRASHFATPIVADQSMQGHVAVVATASTAITVINNSSTNPPTVDPILVNSDYDSSDLFLINNIGLDGRLTIWSGLEIFFDSNLYGARYQFLNHGATANNWVASIHCAYGRHDVSTEVTNDYGTFGPYKANGNHQYFSLGITSVNTGLLYGIEYNRIIIDWNEARHIENQDALGAKLGYAW